MKHPGKARSVIFALAAGGTALAAAGTTACWGTRRSDGRTRPAPPPEPSAMAPDAAEEPISTEPDPLTSIAPRGPGVAEAGAEAEQIPPRPGPTAPISPAGPTR
jgi:hypothetical protein